MKHPPAYLEFSFLGTRVGEMLIARSSKGLAAIMLANNQYNLIHALKTHFPETRIDHISGGLTDEKTIVRAIMHGEATVDEISLDIQGTIFQNAVWQTLMRIPYATTISYQQLAQHVGKASATRAVAAACGANPVAIVVPCHRVVRKNGDLGGYHWGLDIKRDLLSLEQHLK